MNIIYYMRRKFVMLLSGIVAVFCIQLTAFAETNSITHQLEELRKQSRTDITSTANAVRAMDASKMNDEDRATWLKLSRDMAVRTGDRVWLDTLREMQEGYSMVDLYQVLLANAYMNEGDLPAAHASLARVRTLDNLNTRDQRRYWAIQARLAQLEGNRAQEREALGAIVHEISRWPSQNCMSCHDNVDAKGQVPLLDVRGSWVTQRYVQLLREDGDAYKMQQEAMLKLLTEPEDVHMQLILALTADALGQNDKAEQVLRAIKWVDFPNRKGPKPRMLFLWP